MSLSRRTLVSLLTLVIALSCAACGSGQTGINEAAIESYLPMLQRELKNEDPTTRRNAARGLGRLGRAAREALPALACAATDTDPEVCRAATLALDRIQCGSNGDRKRDLQSPWTFRKERF